MSVEFESWNSYWEFQRAVQLGRRYLWSRRVRKFLKAVRNTAHKREFAIAKNQPFFRAQAGWARDVEEREDGTLDGPVAFDAERMKPIASRTPDGRANAAGIPVLYLALDEETAIAEVRPWIGSQVSLSRFRTTKELKALNLTKEFGKIRIAGFLAGDDADAEEKEKSVWKEVDPKIRTGY